MDYNEFLPHIGKNINKILKNTNEVIISKTTPETYQQIRKELSIYFNYFRNNKIENPEKAIDDHVAAILMSYAIDPNLNIMDRDAHYNGTWYAIHGICEGKTKEEVKVKCSKLEENNPRWTAICLMAIEQYYAVALKNKWKLKLLNSFRSRTKKKHNRTSIIN